MTVEKEIRAFCARRHLDYEFQDLKNMGERVVAETHDPGSHAAVLKAACRLRGVTVIDWTHSADGGFNWESGSVPSSSPDTKPWSAPIRTATTTAETSTSISLLTPCG